MVATVTCGCMLEVSTRPSQLSSRDAKLESECESPAPQAVGVNGVSSIAWHIRICALLVLINFATRTRMSSLALFWETDVEPSRTSRASVVIASISLLRFPSVLPNLDLSPNRTRFGRDLSWLFALLPFCFECEKRQLLPSLQ